MFKTVLATRYIELSRRYLELATRYLELSRRYLELLLRYLELEPASSTSLHPRKRCPRCLNDRPHAFPTPLVASCVVLCIFHARVWCLPHACFWKVSRTFWMPGGKVSRTFLGVGLVPPILRVFQKYVQLFGCLLKCIWNFRVHLRVSNASGTYKGVVCKVSRTLRHDHRYSKQNHRYSKKNHRYSKQNHRYSTHDHRYCIHSLWAHHNLKKSCHFAFPVFSIWLGTQNKFPQRFLHLLAMV